MKKKIGGVLVCVLPREILQARGRFVERKKPLKERAAAAAAAAREWSNFLCGNITKRRLDRR